MLEPCSTMCGEKLPTAADIKQCGETNIDLRANGHCTLPLIPTRNAIVDNVAPRCINTVDAGMPSVRHPPLSLCFRRLRTNVFDNRLLHMPLRAIGVPAGRSTTIASNAKL